jgi:Flp pilus assembly protein TadG
MRKSNCAMAAVKHRRPKHARRKNLGAAAVEFAVVSPLLVMLTFGMIEVSRLVMVKQLLINASREGARLAVLPTANEQQVLSQVQGELTAAFINGATVSLSPQALSSAPAGTPITVSIQVNATSVSWLPKPMFVISQTISAATTMRRESL